jgi:hypothetical protein
MRSKFEHPLKPKDIHALERSFEQVNVESYVLTSLASLVGAYVPGLAPFKTPLLKLLEPLDDALFRAFAPLKYLGWTSIITCERPRS